MKGRGEKEAGLRGKAVREVRKAIKNRKVFPTDNSAMKVVYLAIEAASKKWTMPIHNWKAALNRFMIEFPDRMPEKF